MERESLLRLLDVNFNRAAEGLRTLEDIARVVREDVICAAWLKALRHELAALASVVTRPERLAARSVQGDVGTGLTAARESQRGDWSELITAAAERVTQSLRVIEEASKPEFPTVAATAKQFRYRAYDRLAQVEQRLSCPTSGFAAPPLYLLIDCGLPIQTFAERLQQLAEAGVGLFQLRDKQLEADRLLRYARAAVAAVGSQRVIVNDRLDIALASGAGGVHVGQEDLPLEAVQRIARGRLWIGVSTHDLDQALAAQAAGADYIGCGPTFPSQTKQFDQFAGVELLRQVAARVDLPAYAIGGINGDNLAQVRQAGVHRVAVGHAIWAAEQPAEQARRLVAQLG